MKGSSSRTQAAVLAATMLWITPPVSGQTVELLEAGPDHSTWQSITRSLDEFGQQVAVTNTWTELSSGLNFWTDRWERTVEGFEIAPEGHAVARKGPHRLVLEPNLRTQGAIDLLTPDGRRFRSHLLGLAYCDPASGQSVLIAEPKDSIGVLVASNRVVWGEGEEILVAQASPPQRGVVLDYVILNSTANLIANSHTAAMALRRIQHFPTLHL